KSDWRLTPTERFPEPDEAVIRALALDALQAAREAGAEFAEVRFMVTRVLIASASFRRGEDEASMAWPYSTLVTGYGVRAIVDGPWGSSNGSDARPGYVVQTGRDAVMAARANRRIKPGVLDLAPVAPNVTGRWTTPIDKNPFTIPIAEQGQLMLDAINPLIA